MKTAFVEGSDLLPAFAQSIFGTDQSTGHKHDGADSDGHCPKIDPVTEISGYSEGSFTMTATGFSTNPAPSGTAYWHISHGLVFLSIPLLYGTSNTTDLGISLAIPADIRPATGKICQLWLVDNGQYKPGLITVNANGIIESSLLATGVYGGAFVDSGNKGVFPQTIIYRKS
jgi:hypothetical protein